MRLLPRLDPSPASPPPRRAAASAARTRPDRAPKSNGSGRLARESKAETARQSPTPAVARAVDYSRPTTRDELLMELQRRVIAVEEQQTRKLTAAEFAIVLEGLTGRTVDQWSKDGYVIHPCDCSNIRCKGWRITPVMHHRTAAKSLQGKPTEVGLSELRDMPVEVPLNLDAIFEQMYDDGLIRTNAKGHTVIPPDGPISWTHEQQLAFAHEFELDDLVELRGQPRELQRQLIERLHEIGYKDILTHRKEKK